METCDILIKDCRVLQPDMTISEPCSVAIGDTRILKLGASADLEKTYQAVTTLQGENKLLMPGLVDAHMHVCQTLLRGKTTDEYPMVWTRFLVPFESNLQPEDTYVSTQLACLEMIKNGTTGFADSGGVHMHRAADAVLESGMRAAIAKSTMDIGNAIVGSMKETAEESIQHTIDLYNAYQGAGDGRVDIFFAIRQLMTCSEKLLTMVQEESAKRQTGVHMHLCEHRDEVSFCLQTYRKRPAAVLNDLGLLSPRLLTAHNVMLTDADIQMMADHDVKIVHCPRSNLANHGFPKTPRILQAGASVGLGSDGCASNGLDLFDEMKIFHYAMICYWGLAAFDPVVLPCATLLKMATQGGANALGHGQELGAIAPGKKADVILLNLHQPHLEPAQNLLNAVVDNASGRDVTDSIINGKLVMKDRQVLTMDEERILSEARQHMQNIVRRAGI